MIKRGGRSLSSRQRALFILPIWITSVIWMWSWWLQGDRVNFLPLFVMLSLAMLYEFVILPGIFLYFVMKARAPGKRIAQKDLKVAIISPCIPSKESIDIVERQLIAMTKITYPHDSWILDEDGSKEVKRLAKKHGVNYFTRKGLRKYNQKDAPFKKKTKAGNVNAWIDRVKRRKYDFFVQLDIDHIPKPNYLNKTLGYFRDEKVAWVQAPSVYGNHEHWTSRGSSEQELVLQGPLQMGFYGHGKTPFIIGSHTTYRMSAVKEIGGYQPTRAEDHLDTVALSNRGYQGVFIPEIIAVGDGPQTLETYLKQQFAWAYSMTQVLLQYTPKLLKDIPWRQKFTFLFAQTWYPLWAFAYLIMFATPVVSLLVNQNVAIMTAREFIVHFMPTFLAGFLVWWAAKPLMQPKNIGLTWRGMLLHVVRWPVIIKAITSAAFSIQKPYMITPKGKIKSHIPHMQTYRPFLVLGFLSVLSILYSSVIYGNDSALGQMLFASVNAVFMFTICLVELKVRFNQASTGAKQFKYWLKPVGTSFAGFVFLLIGLSTSPAIIAQQENQPNQAAFIQDHRYAVQSNKPNELPTFGLYDPDAKIAARSGLIEHEFIDWNNGADLDKRLSQIRSNGNIPLVTIEPREPEVSGSELLKGIQRGEYDAQLESLSKAINFNNQRIYIRFAHEMELSNLYAWSNQEPEDYIGAYRYVVDFMRRGNQGYNILWLWSPAGNSGAEAYYPGDDVVDIIGVTVLYDTYWHNDVYVPFTELAGQRLWLKQFNKPMWIAEFGVGTDDAELQRRIITESIHQHKGLGYDTILYLNIRDSNISGPDYRLQADNLTILE